MYQQMVENLKKDDLLCEKSTNERVLSLDIARILAVSAVIMTHISAIFVTGSRTISGFTLGNIFDSISRVGVPLFVMVSGALMLDENKDVSVRKLFGKNIKNIVFLLIVWSAVYAVVYSAIPPLMKGEAFPVKDVVRSFINGHYHMWYLYMAIGLYLITPFLRTFVCRANKNMVLLFIGISLPVQFTMPVIQGLSLIWEPAGYLSAFADRFYLDFFCGFTTYYLTGWYIAHIGFDQKWKKWGTCIAGAVSVLVTILYVQFTGDYKNGYSNMNIFIFIYAAGVFCLINQLQNISRGKAKNVIILLSKLSFGVYILHPMILTAFNKAVSYNGAPLLYIMGGFWSVCFVSFICCYIVSRLPVVKKIIRM